MQQSSISTAATVRTYIYCVLSKRKSTQHRQFLCKKLLGMAGLITVELTHDAYTENCSGKQQIHTNRLKVTDAFYPLTTPIVLSSLSKDNHLVTLSPTTTELMSPIYTYGVEAW